MDGARVFSGEAFGKERLDFRRRPAFAIEEAQAVSFVAPVEHHAEDFAVAEGDLFAAQGVVAPLLAFAVVGRHQMLVEVFHGVRGQLRLDVARDVCRAYKGVGNPTTIDIAIHLPRQHRHAAVVGGKASRPHPRPSGYGDGGAVVAVCLLRVVLHRLRHGGDALFRVLVFARGQQFVFVFADVLDLFDRVGKAAQFVHRQLLPRFAVQVVQQVFRDVRLDALVALVLHPVGKRLSAVKRLAAAVAQVVAVQQRFYLFAVVDVDFFRVEVVCPAQVVNHFFDFYFRLQGFARVCCLQ